MKGNDVDEESVLKVVYDQSIVDHCARFVSIVHKDSRVNLQFRLM